MSKSTRSITSLRGVTRILCRASINNPRLSPINERFRRSHSTHVTPRPIFYAFDPVKSSTNPYHLEHFKFLVPQKVVKEREFQHTHAIYPSSLGVPWPTYFPSALESRYWPEAEAAARDFLKIVLDGDDQHVQDQDRSRQIDMVLDAVVSFAVHVAPMGDVTRMKILAKAYTLVFMHDDAVDTGNYNAAIPKQSEVDDENPSYGGYRILAKEILAQEPSGLGQQLLDSFRSWASIGQQTYPSPFSSLEDYMIYRIPDFGAYPVFRTVQFACGVHLTDAAVAALQNLTALCARHYLLTNDIYSFEKEAATAKESDADRPLFNAVRVVQHLMGVSSTSAKEMLRTLIWETERRIHEAYEGLDRRYVAPASEMVYARGLVAAVAGNMYYSATSGRYARVVEGSKLVR